MITDSIKNFNMNFIPSFGANQKKGSTTIKNSKLERTPNTDTVIIKTQKNTNKTNQETFEKYERLNESKLLGKELIEILSPVEVNGVLSFSKQQTKIINLATKRLDIYKDLAEKLANDGNEHIDNIIKQTKEVFGGNKGLGKYLRAREKNGCPSAKDSVSIFNKLVKEFNNKHIKGNILNGLSQPHYNKDYKDLDKDEKELINLYIKDADFKNEINFAELEKVLKFTPKDTQNAINSVRDLIGLRLVLPDDTDMSLIEKYLTDAILTGKLNVTRINNYHSSHIYPYIGKDTLNLWRESVPGLSITSSNDIRKKNGYTTTQMNIIFKVTDKNGKEKDILAELQIRSESLNKLGQIEHLIYDILEGKNISKGIPELKEFYESTGIVNAVNEVFNDPQKEEAYLEYEKTTYAKIRNSEKDSKGGEKQAVEYPLLTDFGLGAYEVLSFESLDYIDKKANLIKKKYGNKK